MVLRARNGWIALCVIFLLACTGAPPDWHFPAEGMTVSTLRYQVETVDLTPVTQGMILAIPEGAQWRWLWLDSFGMPVARMNLVNGQWQNDGFAPPNAQAQALFSALAYLAQPVDKSALLKTHVEYKDGHSEVGEMLDNQFVPFFGQWTEAEGEQEIVVYPSGHRYRLTELVND